VFDARRDARQKQKNKWEKRERKRRGQKREETKVKYDIADFIPIGKRFTHHGLGE
jgi:hypothetical protein